MKGQSRISWTQYTWNPVTGCIEISPGCDNCYARTFSERFRGTMGHVFESGFDITLRPERLDWPLNWTRPRVIFVCSMSDLFLKEIPDDYRSRVFDTMDSADQHIFQILTKRSSSMQKYVNDRYGNQGAPAHMWFGVTVENKQAKSRIRHLQFTNARVRFISAEPLLEPLDIKPQELDGIDQVIAGDESGFKRRPASENWFRSIRDVCRETDTAYLLKQRHLMKDGRVQKVELPEMDGQIWEEYPAAYYNWNERNAA